MGKPGQTLNYTRFKKLIPSFLNTGTPDKASKLLSYFSEKMEEAGEAAGNGMQQEDQVENTWSEIQELANNVIKNNATHGLPHKLIKIKLKENTKQDTLLRNYIQLDPRDPRSQRLKLTKIETLPTSENSINETQVKYFHSIPGIGGLLL